MRREKRNKRWTSAEIRAIMRTLQKLPYGMKNKYLRRIGASSAHIAYWKRVGYRGETENTE